MIRRTKTIFQCDKCKKEIEYDMYDNEGYTRANECHHFTASTPGYGSIFDNTKLSLDLCDNCLKILCDEFGIEMPDDNSIGDF